MPSKIREQAPFEEKVLSERMKTRRIPMNYCGYILERQLTSVSLYLQAGILSKNHREIVLFTAVDVKFLRRVTFKVPTLSELRLNLLEA